MPVRFGNLISLSLSPSLPITVSVLEGVQHRHHPTSMVVTILITTTPTTTPHDYPRLLHSGGKSYLKECNGTTRSSWSAVVMSIAGSGPFSGGTLCNGEYARSVSNCASSASALPKSEHHAYPIVNL